MEQEADWTCKTTLKERGRGGAAGGGQFHSSPAQTGAVSYCRSPGASVTLRIFVAGHQPGTAASSAPGCPPEAGTQEEEKGGGDAPALAFGNYRL